MNAITVVGVLLLVAGIGITFFSRRAGGPVMLAGVGTIIGSHVLVEIFQEFALDSLTTVMIAAVLAGVVLVFLSRSTSFAKYLFGVLGLLIIGVVTYTYATSWLKPDAVSTHAPPYQDSLDTCQDVVLVGLRGSGEPRSDVAVGGYANPGSGYGEVVGSIRDSLKAEVEARGLTFADYPIGYPAMPAYVSGPGRSLVDDLLSNRTDFIEGAQAGADSVVGALDQVASDCGGSSQVVVVGYSQGAYAARMGLTQSSLAGEQTVASVDLIADPLRTADEKDPRGADKDARNGAFIDAGGFSPTPYPGARSWCEFGDIVCGYIDTEHFDVDAHWNGYVNSAFTVEVVDRILVDVGLG